MRPDWYLWLGLAALVVIAVFVFAAAFWRVRYAVNARASQERPVEVGDTQIDLLADLPSGFGYKIAWLAIRSQEPEAVCDSLGFHMDIREADWAEGVQQAYSSDWVFVTPPVDQWVLVVGWAVWPNDPQELGKRLLPLSRAFGESQAFASHRVSSAYAWAKAVEGKMVRWFDLGDGEILANEGEPTFIERELSSNWADLEKLLFEIDEDSVLSVAGSWSIDPNTLDDCDVAYGKGWLCRVGISGLER